MNGHEVSMTDISDEIVQKGLTTFKGNLQRFYVDKVIRGAKTSAEVYQVILNLSHKWGKETITVNDSPGFAI